MNLDDSCQETVVKRVACKALINAPGTGYDIVSDLDVIMTKMKSESAPGAYQRRVYFFHVSKSLDLDLIWISSSRTTGILTFFTVS